MLAITLLPTEEITLIERFTNTKDSDKHFIR